VVFGILLMDLAVPAAAAVALDRADRFDVDRLIVGTTAYGFAGAVVIAVGTAIAGALGLGLAPRSTPVAVALTVAGACVTVPIARLSGRWIGVRLYPERERALAAVRDLTARVNLGSARPEDVQAVLQEALRDPQLTVLYRPREGGRPRTLDGRELDPSGRRKVTARFAGEEVGLVVAGPSKIKPPPAQIGPAVGFLLEAVRLRAGLNRALADVAASRARIIQAGLDERIRLERDLHDGAQQRLVSLGMALRVLQRRYPEATGVSRELDGAVDEITAAIADLRRIAHGLRPSALADGLGSALADLARRSPIAVRLELDVADVPDLVATSAYYVAAEAITNAVRHAEADALQIEVAHRAEELRIRISDDGRGGAVLRSGSGLAGLQDRITALGGRFSVVSIPNQGTTVEAALPCAS
jgi:signal transduction histidine kinase